MKEALVVMALLLVELGIIIGGINIFNWIMQ